jgi:DNA-binding transcriptional ArsR family regulator
LSTVVLTDPVLELVVRRMHLLADPLRMRLLLALQDREASVQELADALEVEHRNASRSLGELHREGILARRRDGTRRLYSIADYTTCRLVAQMAESVIAHVEELHDAVIEDD